MKYKILKSTLMIGAVISSISAYGLGSTGEVKRIYPNGDQINFRLKNDTCITGSQYYFFKMNENDISGKYASKNWYSMLLASAMASKPVSVSVNECPAEGNVEIKYIYQDY